MILVVDVSNVFNKCRTSSILLLLLLATCLLFSSIDAANQPDNTIDSWTWNGPVGSIQGSYQMAPAKIHDHPPTLASLWELGGSDFNIVVWPPKYCAAVHVYFIDSTTKGVGHFHVLPDMTKGPYVKYNMPTGQIELSRDGVEIKSHFNQRSSIPFKHQSDAKYVVTMAAKHVDKIKNYNSGAGTEKVTFDLTGKIALVLTNSRFCFAHITKDGNNGDYMQLFDAKIMKNEKPSIITTFDVAAGIPSLFNPIGQVWAAPVNNQPAKLNNPKSVDLLPMLAKPEFYDPKLMRAPKQCNGFVTTSRDQKKKSIGLVTVDSWTVQQINGQLGHYDEHFNVAIGPECSWIRLWISPGSTTTMDDYATKMQLSETIDIFLDQQFFVGPDSDEARPLSGNSSQIDRISIRRHVHGKTTGKSGLVQMSYGRDGGVSLPYIEYFYMPSMEGQDLKIHLIKAAKCEANIITAPETRLSSANQPRNNVFEFPACKKYFLKNENKNDVADS